MSVEKQPSTPVRLRMRAASAGSGATAATRKAVTALVEAVGELADAAIERVLLSDERVTSAAEAKRLLAGEADTEALADKIQRVVIFAVPVVRMLARGPASPPSLGQRCFQLGLDRIAVRSGVRGSAARLPDARLEEANRYAERPHSSKSGHRPLPPPQANTRPADDKLLSSSSPQLAAPRSPRTNHRKTRGKSVRRGRETRRRTTRGRWQSAVRTSKH
jgi:hypothetical protein